MEIDLNGKSVQTPRLTLLYCLEWLRQFLVQAFGPFREGTSKGSLDLPKSVERK